MCSRSFVDPVDSLVTAQLLDGSKICGIMCSLNLDVITIILGGGAE